MAKKILVGMLLLGALIVFALATFYVENWQFSVLSKGYKLTAHFEQARDLSGGDEVRINGVEVGRIHSISVDTETASERPVAVELYLLSDVKVRAEDTAHIELRSVFGGSYISISRGGTEARLLVDGDEIPNTQVGAGISEVVQKADTLLAEASESLGGASKTLDNLGEITRNLAEGEGTLGKLLTDEEAYNDLQETLASVRDAFASVKEIAVDLSEGEGLFSKLLKDEEMAATVTKFFDDAALVAEDLKLITADLREGKGAAGKLLNDEEMAAKLDQIVTDVQTFSTMLADLTEGFGESTLGRLASDDEIYQKLSETLDQMKTTVASISEGEGTIAKLLNDDKLYKQLTTAMDSVQGLLDDYREQSPILTFAGAIFGAF